MTDIAPYCTYKGNPVYNKQAAMALLGVSEKTLTRYIAKKMITVRTIGVGRYSVAFYEKDLDAFLGRKKY